MTLEEQFNALDARHVADEVYVIKHNDGRQTLRVHGRIPRVPNDHHFNYHSLWHEPGEEDAALKYISERVLADH